MRKSQPNMEQILGVLKEVESGLAVGVVCRKHGISDSIPGERVVRVLDRLRDLRGLPEVLVTDNGPEFAGQALDV